MRGQVQILEGQLLAPIIQWPINRVKCIFRTVRQHTQNSCLDQNVPPGYNIYID